MDLLPLIAITGIYFAIAMLKPYIQPRVPIKICAICTAVSVTWLILLTMWLTGSKSDLISIAILLGMSISGIMYKAESFYKEKRIKNFWFVRLVLIIGGFYVIYSLLSKDWNLLIFLTILSLFLIAISSLLFQGTTHADVVKDQKGRKSSLIKKLEDCC